MGKQIKKNTKHKKKSKWQRTCEICGNETFTPRKVFKCPYCGEINGLQKEE